mgnify:CR=1 FL=1
MRSFLAAPAGTPFSGPGSAWSVWPTLITLGIATVLAVWSAYGLSGAGLLPPLPLLGPGLAAISAVYLVRALVFVPAVLIRTGRAGPFAWTSSAIVLVFGLAYAIGTWTVWDSLP